MALIEELNALAAAHGVGRIDLVENRLVGMKSRGAYETPGGTLLVLAHRELEALCVDRETAHYAQMLSLRYAELVYYGLVVHGVARGARCVFLEAQQRVTGTVGLRLYKGNVNVTRRQSPYSLYRTGSGELFAWRTTTPRMPKASSIFSPCRSLRRASESAS